jgi:hypothetical protein
MARQRLEAGRSGHWLQLRGQRTGSTDGACRHALASPIITDRPLSKALPAAREIQASIANAVPLGAPTTESMSPPPGHETE